MSLLQNFVRTKRYVKIMMDNGTSTSIMHNLFAHSNEFHTRKAPADKWSKMAGSFSTSCKNKVKIKLQGLDFTARIFAPFHVTSQ